MKQSLSSVDVMYLAKELGARLRDARFDKAYQIGKREFLIKLHLRGEGSAELLIAPNFVCITSYKRKTPETPTGFAMQLRKRLGGGFVRAVRQVGFDRILEIEVEVKDEKYLLVVELFSKGNLFLLDSKTKILGLLEWQKWKDRTLGVGQTYEYPPEAADPRKTTEAEFRESIPKSEKKIASLIVTGFGLSGEYAEEACRIAGVEKDRPSKELGESEVDSLWNSFSKIIGSFNQQPQPVIIVEGGENVSVTPTRLSINKDSEIQEFKSFNEAVDEYFKTFTESAGTEKLESKLNEKRKQLEKRVEQQKETLEKFKRQEAVEKQKGDLIYQHYQEIEALVKAVEAARKKGLGDNEISKTLLEAKKNSVPEAKIFLKLRRYELEIEV